MQANLRRMVGDFYEAQGENYKLRPQKKDLTSYILDLKAASNGIVIIKDNSFIAGVVLQTPHSEALVAQEEFFWIDPAHRSLSLARVLMKEFEQEAKSKGCSLVFFSARDPRVHSLYKRGGYNYLETSFFKEI
jgi:GNAT superfamily N-acetyltransferase